MYIQQKHAWVITLCTCITGMKSPKYKKLILKPIYVVRSWRNFGKISLVVLQSLCEKEILCANFEILRMASIKLANNVIYDQMRWIFSKFRYSPAYIPQVNMWNKYFTIFYWNFDKSSIRNKYFTIFCQNLNKSSIKYIKKCFAPSKH